MRKLSITFALVLLFGAFAQSQTKPEVLGVRLGMSREEVHRRLEKVGRLEKEERKQQEVWAMRDERYEHLIIGFNKDYTAVRFVTARARAGGRRVQYKDVLDTKKARQLGAANNYKYMMEVPATGGTPAFVVIAQGRDPKYLTYYSLEVKD